MLLITCSLPMSSHIGNTTKNTREEHRNYHGSFHSLSLLYHTINGERKTVEGSILSTLLRRLLSDTFGRFKGIHAEAEKLDLIISLKVHFTHTIKDRQNSVIA